MDPNIMNAMKRIGIYESGSQLPSIHSIQQTLKGMRKTKIKQNTGDFLILMKYLPGSLLESVEYEERKEHEAFRKSMQTVKYDAAKHCIRLVLEGTITDVSRKLITVQKELFDGNGFIEEGSYINLEYLVLPNDSSHAKYDGCKISLANLDDDEIEVTISGCHAILVLVFYFERMIGVLLDSKETSFNSNPESLPDIHPGSIIDSSIRVDDEVSPFGSVVSSECSESPLCVDCVLLDTASKIKDFSMSRIPVSTNSCQMLCYETTNALKIFSDAFSKYLVEADFSKKFVETLNRNMVAFVERTLSNLESGSFEFYLYSLISMHRFSSDDKDKLVTFLNCIAPALNTNSNFPQLMKSNVGKSARKFLFEYMRDTSNFLALQAVIESLITFYRKGIDIVEILPENSSLILDQILVLPKNIGSVMLHSAISDITRKFIRDVLEERNIEIYELFEEKFMNEEIPCGRDLFLYYRKLEKILCHLVVFDSNEVYLEQIALEDIEVDDTDLTVKSSHWVFTLKDSESMLKLMDKLTMSSGDPVITYERKLHTSYSDIIETENVEPVSQVKFKKEVGIKLIEKENVDNDRNSSEESTYYDNLHEENCRLTSPAKDESVFQGSNSDSDDNKLDDSSKTVKATLKSCFKVKQDLVFDYWKENRSFVRERTGKDWPMMYGSPCAVVIRYEHVKSLNSRKRNASFGRLSGVCTICDSQHKYEIKLSPFREDFVNNKVEYSVERDMEVQVSVEGTFHLQDGKPEITLPAHSILMAKGLDLRGEERELIAKKASLEGAKSVYREGMAFMQREQIESHNRTSVRSLPVIK